MHVWPITLDIRKPEWRGEPVRIMQGDANATMLRASVLDGGEPFDASRMQARFECVKPDGTWVRDQASVTELGAIEYVLPPQVAECDGLIDSACFRLLDGADEVGSSGMFAIEIIPSIDSAGAGESGSYCPELDGLIADMRDLVDSGSLRDYNELSNLPSICGRTVAGSMALEDIGIVEATNADIEAMFAGEDKS